MDAAGGFRRIREASRKAGPAHLSPGWAGEGWPLTAVSWSYAYSGSIGNLRKLEACSLHGSRSSLSFLCAAGCKRGTRREPAVVSGTKIDQRSKRVLAVVRRDDELIARAAKRADWAGAALRTAARDLSGAHGDDGNPLTGLAEVVLEQAVRASSLAEDIERRRPPQSERRSAAPRAAGRPPRTASRTAAAARKRALSGLS